MFEVGKYYKTRAGRKAISSYFDFVSKKNWREVGKLPIAVRLWAHVDIRDKKDCWDWKSNTDRKGYGCFVYRRKNKRAHVVSYELAYGQKPVGRIICHTCDNRLCVNPSHLYAGTHKSNVDDCVKRGRTNHKGQHNGAAVLSDAKVLKMRDLYAANMSHKKIAKMYRVSNSAAYYAVTGRTWAHLNSIQKGSGK